MNDKEKKPGFLNSSGIFKKGGARGLLGTSGDRLPTAEEVGAKTSVVPVLAVTNRFRIWKRVKWPLLFVSIVLGLLVVAAVAYQIFVEREIDEVLALVKFNEYTGEIGRLNTAETKLVELYGEYPRWERVNTAYAWQLLFRAELFGPKKEHHLRARELIAKGVKGGGEESLLGKGVELYLDGKYKECREIAEEGGRLYPEASRFALLKALAMSESVETKKTLAAVKAARAKHADYIPLVLFAVKTASEKGTKSQSLRWTRRLLTLSPNHIYGKLFLLEARLPVWGSLVLNKEKFAALREEAGYLRKKYGKDSPVEEQLAQYLEGRFAYHKGNYERAEQVFATLVKKNPAPKYLAWYGQAIYHQRGPDPVLEMLEPYGDARSHELSQLRANCLLAHHRVAAADKIVAKMQSAVDYRPNRSAKRVEWLLAVRQGDIKNAIELLPEIIRKPHQFAALELYWQLKSRGYEAGIQKVITSLGRTFSACSWAIEMWHGKRSRKVMKIHNPSRHGDNPCIQALGSRALRSYLPAAQVAKMAHLASQGAGSENAWIETDRAIIEWMVHGQSRAVKILDDLLARRPDGSPLLYQVARAFLTIDLPERAYELVESCDTPEGIDICIRALRKQGQETQANGLVKKAIAMSTRREHPALYPYKLETALKRPSDAALSEGRKLTRQSGAWTPSSTEHYIKALAKRGDLDDVDLFFQRVPQSLAAAVGLDVTWKIKEFAMLFTLSRGKKYRKRVLDLADEMERSNVRSASLYYGLGVLLLSRNNQKKAAKWFVEALKYDPTSLAVYRRLAKMGKLTSDMKSKLQSRYPSLNLKSLR